MREREALLEVVTGHDDPPVGEDRGVGAEADVGDGALAGAELRIDRCGEPGEQGCERVHRVALHTTMGTAAPSIAITAPLT